MCITRAKTQVPEGPAAPCSHLSSGHQPWKSALITNACFSVPSWDRNSEASLDTGLPGRPGSDPRPYCQGASWSLLPLMSSFFLWTRRRMVHLGGRGGQGQGSRFTLQGFFPLFPPRVSTCWGTEMRHWMSKGSKARIPPCVPLAP